MNIEKDIPPPRGKRPGGFQQKYPFSDMQVGDSVLISDPDEQKNARNAAHMMGVRTGRKFSSRTVEGGVRIWRIE